jgi:hypothetical protein
MIWETVFFPGKGFIANDAVINLAKYYILKKVCLEEKCFPGKSESFYEEQSLIKTTF